MGTICSPELCCNLLFMTSVASVGLMQLPLTFHAPTIVQPYRQIDNKCKQSSPIPHTSLYQLPTQSRSVPVPQQMAFDWRKKGRCPLRHGYSFDKNRAINAQSVISWLSKCGKSAHLQQLLGRALSRPLPNLISIHVFHVICMLCFSRK